MKKTTLCTAALAVNIFLGGCNGTTTTTTTSDSTVMNPGDSSVTTTTTTTVTHHRYTGNFAPQANTKYLDLRTRKQISVKVDSEKGVVNSETNEPVDLLVDPVKHDTIYGQTGTVVNNYIIRENDNYRVDTVHIHDTQTVAVPTPVPVPEPATKGKYKSSTEKIKETNNREKIKEK